MHQLTSGKYRLPNQELFLYAPVTKAWLCITVICSVIYMYLTTTNLDTFWSILSLADLISMNGFLRLILSRFIFQYPSSFISGIILIYYGRWLERRFGCIKFTNFILLNILQSAVIEICICCVLSVLSGNNPLISHLAYGPYALLTALYLKFLREFPLVPYVQIFGISLSLHSLPFVMFIQLLQPSQSVLTAFIAGALSLKLYEQYSGEQNIFPDCVIKLFRSTSNPIGALSEKFAQFGEFWKEEQILPVAATVEQQRMEIMDRYEKKLIFWQMRRVHMREQNRPSGNQLHFLSRLLGITSDSAAPSEEQIRSLMDMGLGSRQVVIEALQRCGNDASEAINLLLRNNS